MVIIFILLIGIGVAYFLLKNPFSKQEESKEISYETIQMITNIRLGISDFDSIHPYLTKNREILYLDQLIFEPLLTITQDYKIENCLAKEWTKVGEKSYLLKLKENVTWQDGSSFRAEDVKFSIETLQKEEDSIYIENVKDIAKVEIVDDTTIRLELTKEIPFFEYQLIFPIIQAKQYENQTISSLTQIPLGTGMYQISKLTDDQIQLVKNTKWHKIDQKNANLETITVSIYETMGEIYNEFKLGNIDMIHTTNENVTEYIGSMGYGKKEYENREYDYLAFNCEDSILQYPEVRKAISLSLNQERITASVLESKATASYFSLPEGHYLLGDATFDKKTDVGEAKDILQEAGWKYEYGIWQKEIEGRTRTLNFSLAVQKSDEKRVAVAKEIQTQLENIGIKITIEQISDTTYQNYLKNHQYEILLTGVNTSLSPDLTSFLGKGNLANYENEEIYEILEELNNITEESLQKEKYKRILEIYSKEVPYIGLYRNYDMIAYNQNLMGEISPNHYGIYYHLEEWYRK